jgi:phosphatidylglycerol lysyltransferase
MASARTAVAARQAGWVCVHGADDAILDLARFSIHTPEHANLRRKLRKAAKSGVTIRPMRHADLPCMAEAEAELQAEQHHARGGSMGRFCPEYLSGQHVLVAEAGGYLVGFVSLQRCAGEWALDLMRHVRTAPDGTIYALVHAAIAEAAHAGVARFSLAAVPACPDPQSAFWRFLAFRIAGFSRSAGLRQFKSSFAPRWQPLYLAAPSRLALIVGALDIAREVLLPSDLEQHVLPDDLRPAHDEDEINEVASNAAA